MHFDDAWVEAELERQLHEMGPVSDCESEPDSNDVIHPAEVLEQRSAVSESTNSEQLPVDMLPSSFQELMRCMQDWEAFVAADTEKEMTELQKVVETAESQMQKSPAPLNMDDLDDEERAAVESSIITLKYEKTWWRWSLHLVQCSNSADSIEESVDDGSQQNGEPDAEIETATVQRILDNSIAIEEVPSIDQRYIEEERRRFEEEQRRVEQEQQRVEAERINALVALEKERISRMRRMAEEEEQRRQEEERCREEMAMYSEEIRLQEFYEYERRCRRREWRCFGAEDRRSSQMRDEERKSKELEEERILRERREREFAESRAMAREDAFASRWREVDRESCERTRMALADADSEALREEVRRERELLQLARADLEAHNFREFLKVSWEIDRMMEEDGCSSFLRNVASASIVKTKKRMEAARGSALVDVPLASQTPSAVLAGLVIPPCPKRSTAYLKESTVEATRSSTALHRPHDSNMEVESSFLELPAARDMVIDPWSDSDALCCSEHASSDTSRMPPGDENKHLCTSALCKALKEGMDGWRNAGLAWRKPPATSVRHSSQNDVGKRQFVQPASSASSTPRGAGLLESHDFDLHESGLDDSSIDDLIKFEVREERLEQIPRWLPRAVGLRILNLTGNRLKNLDPISDCIQLEELLLCQNALTSLKGLRKLERLVVLRATANKIVDASDIADLQCLRVLALSMNQLDYVQWRTSCLARLELYGNALVSSSFLEYLPSLTYLDLGRNQFTSLDPRISEWNPFLIKLYLYENRIGSLSPLMLPLLTDLVLNKNCLTALGPLGFLPSLERLQAKENKIASLASPIVASPLLQTLALTDNMLVSTSALEPVFEHPRLQQLHLNENPVVADLMETYRPWVLQNAPYLLELDNEPVKDTEKMPAILSRAVNDPYFAFKFGNVQSDMQATPREVVCVQKQERRPQDRGLLGLTKPLEVWREEDEDHQGILSSPSAPNATYSQSSGCVFKPKELLQAGYDSAFDLWRGAFEKFGDSLGGCTACSLAIWCECLLGVRSAPMSAHLRDERLLKTNRNDSKDLCSVFLWKRRDFWASFLDLCCEHYEKLLRSPESYAHVCRNEFQAREVFTRRMCCRIQARWRGIMARRQFAQAAIRIQAIFRGSKGRRETKELRRQALRAQAAIRIQAMFRGSRGRRSMKEIRRQAERERRKLDWAREMSKVREEDDEMAEIDLGQLLRDLDVKSLGDTNAFAVKVPEPVMQVSSSRIASPVARGLRNSSPDENDHPMTAWGTPPATAMAPADAGRGNRCTPLDLNSSVGSPSSNAGSRRPQRTRSLSSTAESAVTENEGFRRGSHTQPNQDESNPEESRAARAFYEARQRGGRPPGLPKVTTPSMASRGGVSRGGSLLGRGSASGRGGRRVGQDSHSVGKDKPCLKAQDQLAAYFKAQQQESQGRASPDSDTLEFSTGPLNHKLLRSAMQSPPHSNSSPRACSPKRLSS